MLLTLILEFDGAMRSNMRVVQSVRHDFATLEPVQKRDELGMPIDAKPAWVVQSAVVHEATDPGDVAQQQTVWHERVKSPVGCHTQSRLEMGMEPLQSNQAAKPARSQVSPRLVGIT